MSKILVCGAKGQLGTSIRDLSGNYPGLKFQFTDIEELDILDSVAVNLLVKESRPDFIVNCAAYTMVDKAETEREKAFLINAEAVRNLHNAAVSTGAKLIHTSTDYVFSGRNCIPYTESDLPEPASVYGISKLKGEMILENSASAIVIRTSWLYSPYGHNFLKTVLRLGKEKPELRMVYDQTGTPTYAADLAELILKIITASGTDDPGFVPGLYHFSNEGVASWYDFAREILEISGIPAAVNPILTSEYPLPAVRPPYSVLNKKKIKETYGIHIRHWKEALKDCLERMPAS